MQKGANPLGKWKDISYLYVMKKKEKFPKCVGEDRIYPLGREWKVVEPQQESQKLRLEELEEYFRTTFFNRQPTNRPISAWVFEDGEYVKLEDSQAFQEYLNKSPFLIAENEEKQ